MNNIKPIKKSEPVNIVQSKIQPSFFTPKKICDICDIGHIIKKCTYCKNWYNILRNIHNDEEI